MADHAYYLRNREKIIAKSKEWGEKNPDKKRAIGRAYKERNREKIRVAGREYGRRNAKRVRARKIATRFRFALQDSRRTGKRRGYVPCIESEDTIARSFTGKCFVCETTEAQNTRLLCLDHCHITGRFRGWLCHKCNLALGNVDDSVERLGKLAQYLEASGAV